jgi:uncharacterized protein (DUF983 family)
MKKLKCPNCGKLISIKWFISIVFLGLNNITYTCKECKSTLKFNSVKNKVNRILFLIVVSIPLILAYTRFKLYNRLFTFLLVFFIAYLISVLLLALVFPQQFSEVKDFEKYKVKK